MAFRSQPSDNFENDRVRFTLCILITEAQLGAETVCVASGRLLVLDELPPRRQNRTDVSLVSGIHQ
jgi:hypothetical protein